MASFSFARNTPKELFFNHFLLPASRAGWWSKDYFFILRNHARCHGAR
jgi:hypothetical protein